MIVLLRVAGLVNPDCIAFIGSGVVVHVPAFFKELDTVEKKGTAGSLNFDSDPTRRAGLSCSSRGDFV